MLVLLASLHAVAAPVVGLDYVPFGRGDLTWVDDGQGSGSLVGEHDGLVRPPLTAWGGFINGRDGVLFGLGIARVATSVWEGDRFSNTHAGTLRIGGDYRRYFGERVQKDAIAYLQAGAYGLVPSAGTVSDSFTDAEQEDADAAAQQLRSRLGGVGLRFGGGVELGLSPAVAVGARYLVVGHLTRAVEGDVVEASTLVLGEAGLVLGFNL